MDRPMVLVKTLTPPMVELKCMKHAVDLALFSGQIIGQLEHPALADDESFANLRMRALRLLMYTKSGDRYTRPEKRICQFVATFPKAIGGFPGGMPIKGASLNRKVLKSINRRKSWF